MRGDVATVIVTFKSREYIGACLASLRSAPGPVRVIVVDNASGDGTVEFVRDHFPEVVLVPMDRNVGFAAGVNRGIRECPDAAWVFLLNPDGVVLPEAIPRLLAFGQEHPGVGIVGPRVFDDLECRSIQPTARRFPSLRNALFNRTSLLTRLFTSNSFSRAYLYEGEEASDARPVDWVMGCAMLIRRRVLDSIGALDEGFFFFLEDIDFCWRARKAGWNVMYYPGASVVHFYGKSAERVPYRTLLAKHASMVRLYRKHIRRTALTDPLILFAGWVRLGLLLGREALRRR